MIGLSGILSPASALDAYRTARRAETDRELDAIVRARGGRAIPSFEEVLMEHPDLFGGPATAILSAFRDAEDRTEGRRPASSPFGAALDAVGYAKVAEALRPVLGAKAAAFADPEAPFDVFDLVAPSPSRLILEAYRKFVPTHEAKR